VNKFIDQVVIQLGIFLGKIVYFCAVVVTAMSLVQLVARDGKLYWNDINLMDSMGVVSLIVSIACAFGGKMLASKFRGKTIGLWSDLEPDSDEDQIVRTGSQKVSRFAGVIVTSLGWVSLLYFLIAVLQHDTATSTVRITEFSWFALLLLLSGLVLHYFGRVLLNIGHQKPTWLMYH
jgi:hypothetical protein